MEKRVGILHGTEGPFPYDLVRLINSRNAGVNAEQIKINAVPSGEDCAYDVIIDRISHVMPYFRDYTRNAFISGTYVINNPFRFYLEKFFAYGVAKKIGVTIPRTILLPTKDYPEGIRSSALENIKFPINWGEIAEKVGGFPAVIKPSEGGGWRDVSIVHDQEELMDAYDRSGKEVMILQEYIKFEHFVRVLVFGKKHVMPVKYNPFHKFDPSQPAYIVDHNHLSAELGYIIVNQAIALCNVLDYDMNSVEFAIKDGVPYAIDFCNQVPDARPEVVTPFYYEWILQKMADISIEYALNPPQISCWPSFEPVVQAQRIRRAKARKSISIIEPVSPSEIIIS